MSRSTWTAVWSWLRFVLLLGAAITLWLWLLVAESAPGRPAYSRHLYRHWTTEGCQDTRTRVLIRDALNHEETWSQTIGSEEPPRGLVFSDDRCRVVTGRWRDPYSGRIVQSPTELDVDHVVALKEAHERGGWRWSAARREEYANYTGYRFHLLPVGAALNRQKGAKAAAEWTPPDPAFRCRYGEMRATIAVVWGLDVSSAERAAIRALVATC